MIKIFYLFIFAIIQPLLLFSQIDTEFWFVVPDVDHSHGDAPIYFNFTTQSQAATITLSQPAEKTFTPIVLNLAANTSYRFKIEYSDLRFAKIENSYTNNGITNKGILIKSNTPITSYYEVSSGNNPDMFSLKGSNALGTEFYTPFQKTYDNNTSKAGYSSFQVVATEDNTEIEITPSGWVYKNAKEAYPPGIPYKIKLNKGQTYIGIPSLNYASVTYISQYAKHKLAGTHIVTNGKKVAVTLHDDNIKASGYSCYDLMGDQNIPLDKTGNEYIAMRGQMLMASDTLEKLVMLSTSNNNMIFVNGIYKKTLNKGETYTYTITTDYVHVKGKYNFYALQLTGYGCEFGEAILPPISGCIGSPEVTVTTSDPYATFLNILVTSGDEGSFLINGTYNATISASKFIGVPGTSLWKAARIGPIPTAIMPVGKATTISNTTGLFHLGIINGRKESGGCRFGFFSNFNEFSVDVLNSKNGNENCVSCFNEEISLMPKGLSTTNGNGTLTYLWNTGETTSKITFNAKETKTYIVTVTMKNSVCNISAFDSSTIKVNPVFNGYTNITDTNVCEILPITIEAFNALTYRWSNGNKTNKIEVLPSSNLNYTLTMTDTINCIDIDTIEISYFKKPYTPLSLSDSGILQSCANESLTIETKLNNNYSFFWNTGEKSPSITVDKEGIYSVSVKDTNDCYFHDTVSVKHFPLPNVVIEGDKATCSGMPVSLFANGAIFYTWNTGSTSTTITSIVTTDTSFSVIGKNEFNCTEKDTFPIKVYSNPSSITGTIIGPDSCYQDEISRYKILTDSNYQFNWSTDAGYLIQDYKDSVDIGWDNQQEEATISCSVFKEYPNQILCYSSISKKSKLFETPRATLIIENIPDCYQSNEGVISSKISGGMGTINYSWNNGSSESKISGLRAGEYTLTISDNHRQARYNINLPEPTPLQLNVVERNNILCHGEQNGSLTITASGGTKPYQTYYNNNPFYENEIRSLPAGTYNISLFDSNLCTIDTIVTILEPEPIEVIEKNTRPYCPTTNDGKIVLLIKGGTPYSGYSSYQISWKDYLNQDSIENLTMSEYLYTVTDSNLCQYSDTVLLKPAHELCIMPPSAFSPNNDQINDTWKVPRLLEFYPNASMYIYDRWGNLLYVSQKNFSFWDGKRKGFTLPIDNYFYVIECNDAENSYIQGNILLLK